MISNRSIKIPMFLILYYFILVKGIHTVALVGSNYLNIWQNNVEHFFWLVTKNLGIQYLPVNIVKSIKELLHDFFDFTRWEFDCEITQQSSQIVLTKIKDEIKSRFMSGIEWDKYQFLVKCLISVIFNKERF